MCSQQCGRANSRPCCSAPPRRRSHPTPLPGAAIRKMRRQPVPHPASSTASGRSIATVPRRVSTRTREVRRSRSEVPCECSPAQRMRRGLRRRSRGAGIAFGVLGACAVLANIRMAPLIVIAALLAFVWRPSEERWRWNGRSLWMMPGVALAAAAFFGWLRLAGAWDGFVDGVVRYNTVSNSLVHIAANTFLDRLLDPVTTPDLAMIAAWIAALAGL